MVMEETAPLDHAANQVAHALNSVEAFSSANVETTDTGEIQVTVKHIDIGTLVLSVKKAAIEADE
jgi:hypothetical protein